MWVQQYCLWPDNLIKHSKSYDWQQVSQTTHLVVIGLSPWLIASELHCTSSYWAEVHCISFCDQQQVRDSAYLNFPWRLSITFLHPMTNSLWVMLNMLLLQCSLHFILSLTEGQWQSISCFLRMAWAHHMWPTDCEWLQFLLSPDTHYIILLTTGSEWHYTLYYSQVASPHFIQWLQEVSDTVHSVSARQSHCIIIWPTVSECHCWCCFCQAVSYASYG